MDLISVVIPTKNRKVQLKRAVNSVLKQTHHKLELIIVDDNSTDDTEEYISSLIKSDSRTIEYIKNSESKGGAVSRNIGSTHAIGKYIAFLDSDDEWAPEHLEKSLRYIKKAEVEASFSDYTVINEAGDAQEYTNQVDGSVDLHNLLFSRRIDPRTSSFLFLREQFEKIKFDEKQNKHQDWDVALRFSKNFKMGCTAENTVNIYHDTTNRMSAKMNHEATEYFLQKHISEIHPDNALIFLTYLSWRTAVMEGKTSGYKSYKNRLQDVKKRTNAIRKKDKIKLLLLNFPSPIIRITDKCLKYAAAK